ncbi:hypothetical protein NDU88_010523 [Pleurodeles waltl]|uniref:Uncharacterized protein n=1 Tax=Pleurodeles waltl TaxID=8319 RepID=A0AAV7S1M0_PLEWA|nr:hypothetical protein NDU88_010523 [Pleurodeles waltl]
MLTRQVGGLTEESDQPQKLGLTSDGEEGKPRSFMEVLFNSLQEGLQTVRKELFQDLKVVRRDLTEVGNKVSALEDHESSGDEELERLQQEVLRLYQQIDLQALT